MLRVHVLNVGHGDCIVVEFPDRLSVIDINRSEEMDGQSLAEVLAYGDPVRIAAANTLYRQGRLPYKSLLSEAGYSVSLTDPITYIKTLSGAGSVFRFISTHPHMDHLSGLNALRSEVGLTNAWVLPNAFTQDEDELSDEQKRDWTLYEQFRSGKSNGSHIVAPSDGSQGDFWQQDGIHILAPTGEMLRTAKRHNEISYVLLVKHGATKVVLGGDAEQATWDHIVEEHADAIANVTVLKASHHGRDSGYHQEAVKLMSPKCTVVSVGKKPDSDASQKYRQYSQKVLSTRWNGTIRFDLDDAAGGTYYEGL
jgi:beta-lactamase superfamily II metal-dependent hydrolase